ncbi:unnamed protein product [Closterium sp. NIES-53]
MRSPLAATLEPISQAEVAGERVAFNQPILLNGTNPVGGKKDSKKLWDVRLEELVTEEPDGSKTFKPKELLSAWLGGASQARMALKAIAAIPSAWKEKLLLPSEEALTAVAGGSNPAPSQRREVVYQQGAALLRTSCFKKGPARRLCSPRAAFAAHTPPLQPCTPPLQPRTPPLLQPARRPCSPVHRLCSPAHRPCSPHAASAALRAAPRTAPAACVPPLQPACRPCSLTRRPCSPERRLLRPARRP